MSSASSASNHPPLSHSGNAGRPSFDLGGRVSHPLRVSEMASAAGKAQSIFHENEDNLYEDMGQDDGGKRRASLLEEFTRDEVGAAGPNKFKSSFAREVVQNVRLSMSAQSPEHGRRRRTSRRLTNGTPPEDLSIYSALLAGHEKYDYRRGGSEGGGLTISSSMSRRGKSCGARRTLISDGIPSPCSSDESLAWTTHQSSNLEVDSLLEGGNSSSECNSSSLKKKHSPKIETRASLESLKKACADLDLNLNELDWIGIRNYLLDRDQLNDSTVLNEDFYNAYNFIMSTKRQDHRLDKKKRNPKESMKSDSGGEMESCRSSDDEEVTSSVLIEEQEGSGDDSTGREGRKNHHKSSSSFPTKNEEISSCVYKDLSQKETELLKLRMDFNAVTEEKEDYKKKYESLKAKLRENDSQLKEVEHLKWQLKTLENSRKTYESATERLMSFLEQVSHVLQSTSPAHKKFIESTRAEVSAIARKTRGRTFSYHSSTNSSLSAISRAESMPSVVHDRQGGAESHFGKRNSASTTSGSMCSLNSTSGSPFEDSPLSVMTLGRKIKRSQSTQSKVGLPIVDEEVNNSLVINSSLLSLSSRKDKPHSSSTPIRPSGNNNISVKKSDSRKRRDANSPPLSSKSSSVCENNTSTESDDVVHCYAVTPPHENGIKARKEDLIREELSKQAVKLSSSPLYQQSVRTNLSCDNISSVDHPTPTTPNSGDETKDDLRLKAHKMLRSMKCILAREKTLNITPKRTHNLKSSKHSSGYHRQSLQLLSHQSSFPGLPSFPVLAVSHTSPWNC